MSLNDFGWNDAWREAFAPHAEGGRIPARVARQERAGWFLCSERGETWATVAGKLSHETERLEDLPAVGDWVAAVWP